MNEILNILEKNHHAYEILQWSLMNSVGSLVYSEFISKMEKRNTPVPHIAIPTIKSVREIVAHDGVLMKSLAEKFLPSFKSDPLYEYLEHLKIFSNEDDTNKVLLLYMIPNIERRLPEVITKKFGLDTDQQTFREDRNIDMFNRQFSDEWLLDYIIEETILQLLTFEAPEGSSIDNITTNRIENFCMNEIVSINNDNAIAPILINHTINKNENALKLIQKVTCSTITHLQHDEYSIVTDPSNKLMELILCALPDYIL